jgi:acyl-CoA synthetase (NDP forming)
MALLSTKTMQRLKRVLKKANLDTLTDIRNPMDVTPMATEIVYESVIKALLEDTSVDAVIAAIVPLTPVLHTLPKGKSPAKAFASENNIAKLIPNLAARFNKPLVMVVDSGPLYDPLADALQQGGLPVFRSADQAVWVLGKYIQGRMKAKEK